MCVKIVVPANAPRVAAANGKKSAADAVPAAAGGSGKIFINLCTVDALNDVSNQKVDKNGKGKSGKSNGEAGTQVSLPYSLSGARPCTDTSGAAAAAYDFVFSAATWTQYSSVQRYVDLFQDMAIDAVLEREGVVASTGAGTAAVASIKAQAARLRNTTFKGGKPPPRLFKLPEDKLAKAQEQAKQQQQQAKRSDAGEESKTQSSKPAATGAGASSDTLKQLSSKPLTSTTPAAAAKSDPRTTPSYQLVHRGFYDISTSGSAGALVGSGSAALLSELAAGRPKELVLKVSLPALASVKDVNLDQAERQVLLSSAEYFLLVALPFPVNADRGTAAWSTKNKTLTVTMEVAPPSAQEIEAFRQQRKPLEQAEARREEERKKSEQAEQQERIAQEQAAEKKRIEEQKSRAEATAAASAPAVTVSSTATGTPPLQSVLKSSTSGTGGSSPTSSSSSSSSSSDGVARDRHVRFSLDASDGFIVPERDGPHGPKPVGLLDPGTSAPQETVRVGKGHRKKHVPGAEGPPTWTGVGVEPEKRLREAFPADRAGPLSPASTPASPSLKAAPSPRASPKFGATAAPGTTPPAACSVRLWPTYTYSQSAVSVVLVVKIKGIAADSVQFHLEDGLGPAAADSEAERSPTTTTRMDLYFSTSSPNKKHYRLFLPLSHAINIAKSNFSVTPQNLLVNLVKQQPSTSNAATTTATTTAAATPMAASSTASVEWDHLADWRVLGEQFDTDGSWLGAVSPAPSPLVRAAVAPAHANKSSSTQQLQGALEELSLGEAHGSDVSSSGNKLVQELDDDASAAAATTSNGRSSNSVQESKPLAPLQPLPSLTASSMLNPLIAAAAGTAVAVSAVAAVPLGAAVAAPHSSLLFQLD
jgi:hypothetical protein